MKKRILSLCLICTMMVMTTGCVGQFRLTNRVKEWNHSFQNQWAKEGVFLACVLLPVYGLSLLGDAIIFNSLEFWGKDNPMASTTVGEGDERIVFTKRPDGSVLVEGKDKSIILRQTFDGVVANDSSGNESYRAFYSDSKSVLVSDQNSNIVLESSLER